MEEVVATLGKGATCCGWNYCGQRLATGYADGSISIHDSGAAAAAFSRSSQWTACKSSIVKVIWVPPEFGDAIACISDDGTLSLWEEVEEDTQPLIWKLSHIFENSTSQVLDLQFGVSMTSLKLVAAHSDGQVKVYELLDPLELNKWQLQAEFQNVIDSVSRFGRPSCVSASIAWNSRRGESQQSSFVLGFNSDLPQFNSSKIDAVLTAEECGACYHVVCSSSRGAIIHYGMNLLLVWEFDEAHQRWLPVTELALPGDKADRVHAVAWAPNIGRPYEVVAVATSKGIAIWHVGLDLDSDGRLPTEKIALLSGHHGEVWQLEWDMSGMTLASTGADGMVKLWQSNLNGVWHEQAALECNSLQQQCFQPENQQDAPSHL